MLRALSIDSTVLSGLGDVETLLTDNLPKRASLDLLRVRAFLALPHAFHHVTSRSPPHSRPSITTLHSPQPNFWLLEGKPCTLANLIFSRITPSTYNIEPSLSESHRLANHNTALDPRTLLDKQNIFPRNHFFRKRPRQISIGLMSILHLTTGQMTDVSKTTSLVENR